MWHISSLHVSFVVVVVKISSSEYGSDDEENESDDGLELVPESSNEGTSSSTRPTLGAKTGTKSKVWQYFGIEIEEIGRCKDINTPVCRLCGDSVKTKHSSTSNLYSHLKVHHPTEYEFVRVKKGKSKAINEHGCRLLPKLLN